MYQKNLKIISRKERLKILQISSRKETHRSSTDDNLIKVDIAWMEDFYAKVVSFFHNSSSNPFLLDLKILYLDSYITQKSVDGRI